MEKNKKKAKASDFTPYLYLIPAFVIFALFVFYPFFKTLYLSMTLTDPTGKPVSFVGFDNYKRIFTDGSLLSSLAVTFEFAGMMVVGCMVIGFILAIASEALPAGKNFFRTMYALPLAISAAAASAIFMFIFHPSLGMVNRLFHLKIGWFTTSPWALLAVTYVSIWMGVGLNFLYLTAALQSVPTDLYESASLDGAGFWQKHFNITIPCISPTLFFLLIINVINAIQAYAQFKMMTQGGPAGSTNVIVYEIYSEAFINSRFGIACAESTILFLILIVITALQFKLEKKVTYA